MEHMKRGKRLSAAVLAVFILTAALTACGDVGIIGGPDGPTQIFIAGHDGQASEQASGQISEQAPKQAETEKDPSEAGENNTSKTAENSGEAEDSGDSPAEDTWGQVPAAPDPARDGETSARFRLVDWRDGSLVLARAGGTASEVYTLSVTDSVTVTTETAVTETGVTETAVTETGTMDSALAEQLAIGAGGAATGASNSDLGTIGLLGTPGAAPDWSAKIGCLLEVRWDSMEETFPGRLDAHAVRILSEGFDDRCGLYLQVLEDLWAADTGLNDRLACLGVDLSGTSLSPAEQSAAAYVFGTRHNLWPGTLQGTYQEFVDRGYITGEPIEGAKNGAKFWQWEDGCLFIIEEKDLPSYWSVPEFLPGSYGIGYNGVCFDAVKWRTSLGAYFFSDCVAYQDSAGRWGEYTTGGEMIA